MFEIFGARYTPVTPVHNTDIEDIKKRLTDIVVKTKNGYRSFKVVGCVSFY